MRGRETSYQLEDRKHIKKEKKHIAAESAIFLYSVFLPPEKEKEYKHKSDMNHIKAVKKMCQNNIRAKNGPFSKSGIYGTF